MLARERGFGEDASDVAFRYRADFEGIGVNPFKDDSPTPIARVEKMVAELSRRREHDEASGQHQQAQREPPSRELEQQEQAKSSFGAGTLLSP